jgi:ferredoxin
MKNYQIRLVNRNQSIVNVAENQFILEAIEAAGINLPVGCRYGACITCAARLIQGEVEQSRAVCLKPEQLAAGYVLLCIALPRSNCQFEVGLEAQQGLYLNPFLGNQ